MTKGHHRLLRFHAKLIVYIISIVQVAWKPQYSQSWVLLIQPVHCPHLHLQGLQFLIVALTLIYIYNSERWEGFRRTQKKLGVILLGTRCSSSPKVQTKVMRKVALSVILVLSRSTVGYVEFHEPTLKSRCKMALWQDDGQKGLSQNGSSTWPWISSTAVVKKSWLP